MADFYQLDPDAQAARLQDLAEQALDRWNIAGVELGLIKYRENAVFSVAIDGEPRYALRIHRPGYHEDDELRSELQWMTALNEYGVETPIVVPAANGEFFAAVQVRGVPESRQVDLFEWIDGEQLGSVEAGLDGSVEVTYRLLGETAARLHNQAAAWQPPPGFRRHAWDAEGLVGEQPLWGRFWELGALDEAERGVLLRGKERVMQDLLEYGQSAELYSLIHADFSPENIMVHGDRVRLIDFDDAGYGWHLFELATALYFLIGDDDYQTARDALIDGYRQHRPLSDAQLSRMPLFMTARGFTYLGWIHTRPETETAQQMTSLLVDMACAQTEDYLTVA